MSLYGRFFAVMYDRMMAGTEKAVLSDLRRELVAQARGSVLEVGAGTGANLPFYGDAVQRLVVAEPELPMAQRLARKLDGRGELVDAAAERLPFEDGSFDTVVATLVLCTVGDQAKALSELWRVLKPDGKMLFIEHVRSDDVKLARLQDRMLRINRFMGYGCNCNRTTVDAIKQAGFTVGELEHSELQKAPPWVRPLVVGTAAR
jgi:ubiquinone/menaquinone biosynthesis C-methylase UbiE